MAEITYNKTIRALLVHIAKVNKATSEYNQTAELSALTDFQIWWERQGVRDRERITLALSDILETIKRT